ncbi:MAG: ATPase domain-containing protein [Thermoplasmata archaeon]
MARRRREADAAELAAKLEAAERASFADDYEGALARYEEALRLDEGEANAWEGKAQALTRLGRYPEAAAAYEQALLRSSSDATNWLERGRALREEGHLEEALPCFEEAVRLEPRILVARLELQEILADIAWESQRKEGQGRVEDTPVVEGRVPLLATHMPPLDASMRGGLTPGSVLLVRGMPGTFKTSLCFWILYQQSLWEGRRTLFITLEQTKENLIRQVASLGMDLEATAGHLRILDLTRHRRALRSDRDPQAWLETLEERVQKERKSGVQSLVLDSLDALQDLAGFRSRRDVFRLFEYLRSLDVTCFLTSERFEMVFRGRRIRVVDAADFLADGIMELSWREREDGEFQRGLRLVKVRDRPHTTSLHHLEWDGGVRLTRALVGPRP